MVTCKKCNTGGLYWHQNQNGNWVLVDHKENSNHAKWVEPHNCAQISKIKDENIAILEKQIESTKKICAEQGVSQEIMETLIAPILEKIAVQRGA